MYYNLASYQKKTSTKLERHREMFHHLLESDHPTMDNNDDTDLSTAVMLLLHLNTANITSDL